MSEEAPARNQIEFDVKSTRRGTFEVFARCGEILLHSDRFNLSDARRRRAFLRRVGERAEGEGIPFDPEERDACLQRRAYQEADSAAENGDARRGARRPDFQPAAVLAAIGLDVLGEQEDQAIECWIHRTRKRWIIKNISKWAELEILQALGPEAAARVCFDGEPPSTEKFTAQELRAAVAIAASQAPRHSGENLIGQGIWKVGNRFLVVNGAGAMTYDGSQFCRVEHPKFESKIIDFNSAKSWAKSLTGTTEAMDLGEARRTLGQLHRLLGNWNWTHRADVDVAAALVPATFIQSCWTWRPLVSITGESDSGKSTLFEDLLHPIFGDWTVIADRATEAGIRQAIANAACPVLIDEFDKYRQRPQVLELFRTASRGGKVLRGTRDQRGKEFGVRHLAWFGAVESGDLWGQDRNRRIRLELDLPRNRGGLVLPGTQELAELGQRIAAAALWAAPAAAPLADRIKSTRVTGVHGRLIECFSVPAAMHAVLRRGRDVTDESASDTLRAMVEDREALVAQGEPDQIQLLRDILASNIRSERPSGGIQEETVAQVLNRRAAPGYERSDRGALEHKGLKIVESSGRGQLLFLVSDVIQRQLLQGTRWAELRIDQILLRLPGAQSEQQRCGGQRPRGVTVPWPACL